MTAFTVWCPNVEHTKQKKKGTYAQSLMPFEFFIILTMGTKRTITVAQQWLNHSILSPLRKSGLGRMGVCFPHYPVYPQTAILNVPEIFSFPFLQSLQDRRLYTTATRTEHQHQVTRMCTSSITTLLQHFIMFITKIHKQTQCRKIVY